AMRQCHDDKLLGQTIQLIGRACLDAHDYPRAERCFLEAEGIAEKLNSRPDIVASLWGLSQLYIRLENFGKAKPASIRLLEVAGSLKNEDLIACLSGQAAAYHSLGNIALQEGDTRGALEFFQKSGEIYEQLSSKRGFEFSTFNSLLGIGSVYYNTGDYGTALEFYRRALSAAEAKGDMEWTLSALRALGLLYMDQADYAKATDFFNRSLETARRADDTEDVIVNLHDLALIDQRQGNYEDAATKFQAVLSLAEKGARPDLIIPPLEGLGSAYHKLGRYDSAMSCYDRALDIAGRLNDRERQCELNWWKGGVYYDLGSYDKSVEFSTRAAKLADDISEPNLSYLALTQLGKARLALRQYDSAAADLHVAIERAEQIRGRIAGQEEQRAFFFERKVEPYYLMVDLLVRENRPEQALEFAERSRSRSLLDMLGSHRLDITKAMTPEQRNEEAKLSGQLTSLNSGLYREYQRKQQDQGRVADLKTCIQSARVSYDSFLDALYASHPELMVDRGQAKVFSIADAASLVPSPDSVALEFELMDDRAYVLTLTRDSGGAARVSVHKINIDKESLGEKVEDLRQRMANLGLGIDSLSSQLYKLLLVPAASELAGKKTLVIVPDGILWDLPFQALRDPEGHYLIEKHSVFYAPSLTALREMMARRGSSPATGQQAAGSSQPAEPLSFPENRSTALEPANVSVGRPTLLALGDPEIDQGLSNRVRSFDRGESLGPLPDAETEVETIGRLYGSARSTVLIGAAATEDRAKAEMSRFSILH
ncbi:MAG: CHAT domain-containing protein, partial [Blastocatellia bacterium]